MIHNDTEILTVVLRDLRQ